MLREVALFGLYDVTAVNYLSSQTFTAELLISSASFHFSELFAVFWNFRFYLLIVAQEKVSTFTFDYSHADFSLVFSAQVLFLVEVLL